LVQNIGEFFRTRNIVPFGLVPEYDDQPCPSIEGLVSCVIVHRGGAFIPINAPSQTANAQVTAAMTRIVSSVEGAVSEFVLSSVPISESITVRVGTSVTHRSQSNGFDYDDASNSLVFHGTNVRPAVGDVVKTAYFVWCGAPPLAACTM
jgi:hypothetical protein